MATPITHETIEISDVPTMRTFGPGVPVKYINITTGNSVTIGEAITGPKQFVSIYVQDRLSIVEYIAELPQIPQEVTAPNLRWLLRINNGAELYCDGETDTVDDGSAIQGLYTSRVVQPLTIQTSLSDVLSGLLVPSEVSFSLDNTDGALNSWLLSPHEGNDVQVYRYDATTRVWQQEFVGKISTYSFGDEIVVTCQGIDTDKLQQEFPKEVVGTDNFPFADPSALGKTIPLVSGLAMGIPLSFIAAYEVVPVNRKFQVLDVDGIHELAPCYDYLVARNNVGVMEVYRNGVPVGTDEYVVSTTAYPGFTVIRFFDLQTDSSGALFSLTADVSGVYPTSSRLDWATLIMGLSPVLWWRLGEQPSPSFSFADSSGNGRTGSGAGANTSLFTRAYGAVLDGDGAVDGALGAGTNARIIRADEPALDLLGGSKSYLFWIAPHTSDNGNLRYIFHKSDAGLNGIHCQRSAAGKIEAVVHGTTVSGQTFTERFPFYHFVVITVSRNSATTCSVRIYQNGSLTRSSIVVIPASLDASAALSLYQDNAASVSAFACAIDEFAIFNYVLPPNQVLSLYNSVKNNQLIVDWKFGSSLTSPVTSYPWTLANQGVQDADFVDGLVPGIQALKLWRTEHDIRVTGTGTNPFSTVDPLNPLAQLIAPSFVRFRFVLSVSSYTTGTSQLLIRGPVSTPSTKGWWIEYTASAGSFSISWKFQTSVLRTLTASGLTYDQPHDVQLLIAPSEFGKYQLYVDGLLVAQLGDSTAIAYETSILTLDFIPRTGGSTWYGTFYLIEYRTCIPGINETGTGRQILRDYQRTKRNPFPWLYEFLVNGAWGAGDQTDGFESVALAWDSINQGQGLPVDITLVEVTLLLDILSRILILRGGVLSRNSSSQWQAEIDMIPSSSAIPEFTHGPEVAEDFLTDLVYTRASINDRMRNLLVNYMRARTATGDVDQFLFQRSLVVNAALGVDFNQDLEYITDHQASAVVAQYLQRRSQFIPLGLTGKLEERHGRTLDTGDFFYLTVPRHGVSRQLYRIQSMTRSLEVLDFVAVQYDFSIYDTITSFTIPEIPEITQGPAIEFRVNTDTGQIESKTSVDSVWTPIAPLSGIVGNTVLKGLSIRTTAPNVILIEADEISIQGTYVKGLQTEIDIKLVGGLGGLDAGLYAPTNWYAIHVVCSADGSTIGAIASASAELPNLPLGVTKFRLVGSFTFTLQAANTILPFQQVGNWIRLFGYTSQNFVLSAAVADGNQHSINFERYVPPGIQFVEVEAQLHTDPSQPGTYTTFFASASYVSQRVSYGVAIDSTTLATSTANLHLVTSQLWLPLSSDRQVNYAVGDPGVAYTGTGLFFGVVVLGFMDHRI